MVKVGIQKFYFRARRVLAKPLKLWRVRKQVSPGLFLARSIFFGAAAKGLGSRLGWSEASRSMVLAALGASQLEASGAPFSFRQSVTGHGRRRPRLQQNHPRVLCKV